MEHFCKKKGMEVGWHQIYNPQAQDFGPQLIKDFNNDTNTKNLYEIFLKNHFWQKNPDMA